MATGGAQGDVTLIANYGGKRLSLTVPTNAKVGDVVQKAVETLNLRREDLPLSLLYQGSPMDDQAPLEVSRSCQCAHPASPCRVAGGSGEDERSDGNSSCEEDQGWENHYPESYLDH